MKLELVFAVILTLIGFGLIGVLQPYLYTSVLAPTDVEAETWVADKYMWGAIFFAAAALVAQLLWFWTALRFIGDHRTAANKSINWWFGVLICILGYLLGLWKCSLDTDGSPEVLSTLIPFFFINGIFMYYLPTVLCTPGPLRFLPPGSMLFRRIFNPGVGR